MITPISLSGLAFKGVRVRQDETKAAIDKLPESTRNIARQSLENTCASLDKAAGDDVDLEIELNCYKYPHPCPEEFTISIYNPNSPLTNNHLISFARCDINRNEPQKTGSDIKKSFANVEKGSQKVIEAIKKGKAEEIAFDLSEYENKYTLIGRNDEARKQIAESLLLLGNKSSIEDVYSELITLPFYIKTAIKENPSLKNKKFAIEFEYNETGEGENKGGNAEVRLVDMDKFHNGDKDPCILRVSGSDKVKVGSQDGPSVVYTFPDQAAHDALLKSPCIFEEFLSGLNN